MGSCRRPVVAVLAFGLVLLAGCGEDQSALGARTRCIITSSASSGVAPGRLVSTVNMSAVTSTVVLGNRLYCERRRMPRQPSLGSHRYLRTSHVVRGNSSSANRRPVS